MKRELQIGNSPVKTFLFDAIPLSIISVKKDYLPWFYSNYIQVCCRKDILSRKELFLQFYGPDQAFSAPYLEHQYYSWEFLRKCKIDIIDFVKSAIDNEYFYYGYVDDFYVHFRWDYQKNHVAHDIFLYGYDDEKKTLKSFGYTTERHLLECEISYDDFGKAFHSYLWSRSEYPWIDRIYLFKYTDENPYELDLICIKELIEDYYFSKNTSERYRRYNNPIQDSYFGRDIYKGMDNYYQLLIEDEIGIDLRVPYLFIEHKKCMQDRLEYLEEYFKGMGFCDVKNDYTVLTKQAKILLSLSLKYQKVNDKKLFEQSKQLLWQIERAEVYALDKILKLLDNCING